MKTKMTLSRVAQLLREEAELIKEGHVTDGEWIDEPEAKAKHDELLEAANCVQEFHVGDMDNAMPTGFNMFELKPCPLCGGSAEFEYTPWQEETETGDDGSGFVECKVCRITLFGYDRDDAEIRWNTRHNAQ